MLRLSKISAGRAAWAAGPALLFAFAMLMASSSFAQSTDAQRTAAAQEALHSQMGDAAKDLTVRVAGGDASLSGWAYAPKDVREATYIVSKVPGIAHAYGAAVQTWTATDHSL